MIFIIECHNEFVKILRYVIDIFICIYIFNLRFERVSRFIRGQPARIFRNLRQGTNSVNKMSYTSVVGQIPTNSVSYTKNTQRKFFLSSSEWNEACRIYYDVPVDNEHKEETDVMSVLSSDFEGGDELELDYLSDENMPQSLYPIIPVPEKELWELVSYKPFKSLRRFKRNQMKINLRVNRRIRREVNQYVCELIGPKFNERREEKFKKLVEAGPPVRRRGPSVRRLTERDLSLLNRDVDYNSVNSNIPLLVAKLRAAERGATVYIGGQTEYGPFKWPFSVSCDRFMFRRFLKDSLGEEKDFFLLGEVTPAFISKYKYLFAGFLLKQQLIGPESKEYSLWNELLRLFTDNVDSIGHGAVHFVSFVTLFVEGVLQRNMKILMSLMGLYSREIAMLFKMMKVKNMEEFISLIPNDVLLSMDGETEEVLLGPEYASERSAPTWYERLLPSFITKSPLTKNIMALTTVVVASKWFTDIEFVKTINSTIAWDKIDETMPIAVLVWETVKSFFEAIKRVAKSWDLKDFFEQPRDVSFLQQSYKLLEEVDEGIPYPEVLDRIERAKSLIKSRTFVPSVGEIKTVMSQLREYVKIRKLECAHCVCETCPLWYIWEENLELVKRLLLKLLCRIFVRRMAGKNFLAI
jgi:hypothetical protein